MDDKLSHLNLQQQMLYLNLFASVVLSFGLWTPTRLVVKKSDLFDPTSARRTSACI
jgi:hypothetical protein